MSMTGQLGLFEGVKLDVPEPNTTVRLGRKTFQIPLRKKRREAIKRLMEILEELEEKDIHIGSFWPDRYRTWEAVNRDASEEPQLAIIAI
jgi:hypothetical protein